MKKLLIHCLLMLIPCSVGAYTPDTCILGPGDGVAGGPSSDNLGTTGKNAIETWKLFKWPAGGSGDAYVFSVKMVDMVSGAQSYDCIYGIWEDDGNTPGDLMVWGTTTNTFNPNTREYLDLDNVVKSRTITAGTMYWLGFRSEIDNDDNEHFERKGGGDTFPTALGCPACADGTQKVGKMLTGDDITDFSSQPPAGSFFTTNYPADYYGWAVWTSTEVTTSSTVVSTTTTTCAVPTISSVTGNISHGETISISGDCFGTKSPVAPLMWDDCESKTVDSDAAVAAVWDEVEPPVGTANQAAYRTRYRTIPYRSKAAPHEYSTKYLAGGHYTYANNSPVYIGGAAEGYKNVMVTADSGVRDKDKWYVSYYYALDNNWMSSCYNYMNHKTDSINSAATAYGIVSEYVYNMYWGNNAPCNSTVYMNISHLDDNCDPSFPSGFTAVNNPRNDWVKMETIINGTAGSTNYRGMLVDNVVGVEYEDCAAWDTLDNQTRSVTIGGYFRHATDLDDTDTYSGRSGGTVASPENNSFRFFDDMYIDYTWARIMMCDSSTYPTTDSYVCEPQIPNTTWNNNAIQATVNLGRINTYTAYVYVIDDDGNVSSGYAVDLEEGQVTTTTTISIGGVAVGGVSIQ